MNNSIGSLASESKQRQALFWSWIDQAVRRLVVDLAEQIYGGSVSPATICRLMRWLDTQLVLWRGQPIAPVCPVVYMDGMNVDKVGSDRTLLLVAGVQPDRVLEVLGFCVSSGEQCTALLEDLRRRGLEQVYPLSAWQYCTFHRLRGLQKTIGPADYRDRMAAEAALEVAGSWRQRWRPFDPWAVEKFLYDLRESLRFYDLPRC